MNSDHDDIYLNMNLHQEVRVKQPFQIRIKLVQIQISLLEKVIFSISKASFDIFSKGSIDY